MIIATVSRFEATFDGRPNRERLAANRLMTNRLSYSLERNEYVAALQAVTGGIMAAEMHQRWLRLLRYYNWIYYLFLALVGAFVIVLLPEAMTGVIVFAMIVVVANDGLRYFIGLSEAAPLGATFDTRRHHDVVAVFGPERASYVGQGHEQSWDWRLLQRFHELPGIFVLEFAGFDMLVVPRRAFSSADQAKRWATEIRGRLAG